MNTIGGPGASYCQRAATRPVTCMVSASGSPRVSGLGWGHDRVVRLGGPGPVAAGCQVPLPHRAPHAGGVAVPAHRAGDRRGWPAAGVRWSMRGNGRLAVAGRVAGRGRGPGTGAVVRRPGTVADRQGALPGRRGRCGPAAETEAGSRRVRPGAVARRGARGGGAPCRPGHLGGDGAVVVRRARCTRHGPACATSTRTPGRCGP